MRDRRGLEVLSREECLMRLGRGGVGRVAVSVGALPAIFPVNYATLEGDVVFRSGPGTKLTAASREAVVAFEVDETDSFSHTGWSVVVVGPAHEITDSGEKSVAARLPLASWAPGKDDAFVRIEGRLVSGRAISRSQPPARGRGDPPELDRCPRCGDDALAVVYDGESTNFLCTRCLGCWHFSMGAFYRLRSETCPGCRLAEVCRSAQSVLRA